MMNAKLLSKRDKWRERECVGCRNNYYNWSKPRSPRGDVAVPDDCCCWSLSQATRNRQNIANCNLGHE